MKHNWEYKKLGEVATFTSGSRPTGGVRGITEGVLSLGGEHIGKDGFIDLTTPKYVSYEYYEANSKGHILDGDILLCKDGALTGKVALLHDELAGKKAMVNEHVFIIRTDSLYQPYLFRYLFSDFGQYELKSRIKGAAQGGLNGSNLRTIPIPLPPLPIQQKIVAELDKVCLIIDKKKQQLKELDNLAQAIFYDMFGDPVENEKGWEVKTMGEIGTLQRGSGLSKKDLVENGHPCILYGQIHTRFGAFTKTHIACIPDYLVNTAKIAHTGDLIMAITSEDVEGSCKSTAWLGNYDIAIGSDAAIFRHNQNGIYISYYTKTKAFYNEKAKFARGFKVTHISTKEIATIPIMIPPLALQQSFAAKIEAIEKQKELISRSIKEAQTLFDERMDYWFD